LGRARTRWCGPAFRRWPIAHDQDPISETRLSSQVIVFVFDDDGAGKPEHFYEALIDGGASAVLAASLFHFGEYQISDVKNYLRKRGVLVR